ncbi:MAG: ABC transporter permease [Terracidiphilus sp.]|jgi:putative ABC transport system permease protein
MRFLRRFLARLKNFATGRQDDQRLREEMEEHLAQQTEENLRAGMEPAEARRQAVLKFGAVQAVRENYHAEQGLLLMEHLLQDARYALRMLARSPGFAAAAILTMALGIGATTAIFSVVDATLLHPLSYPKPDQLVRIEDDLPGAGTLDAGLSVPELKDFQRSGIFQYVSGDWSASGNLTGSSQPLRIAAKMVAPNYFALLGVNPQLGRTFDPHDETPGFNLEVIISDGLWKRAFGGDPHIIGKSLRLDNDENHVIGVLPPGFRDQGRTPEERNTDLWAAAGFSGVPFPPPVRNLRFTPGAIARIAPGLTLAAAQSRMDALVASLEKQYPVDYPIQSAWRVRLVPLKESLVGNVRQSLLLLLGAVGMVLLIGYVNVANLLLARASVRAREIALRQALGAGRKRLVRQLLTESLLLSLLGGATGTAILFATEGLLLRMVPESLPRLSEISIDWNVLLFALFLTGFAGILFGLAPALQASRLNLTDKLKAEGRGTTGSGEQARTRRVLVVMEFALSLVLMIAAGLLLRSFWDVFTVGLGFNPQNVMAVRTRLPVPNDPKTDIYGTAAKEEVLVREMLRRARTLPGVEEAAVGNFESVPLNHDRNLNQLIIEGRDLRGSDPALVERSNVSPGYFHLLGIPLVHGRFFTDQDNESAPQVAIVNEAFARTWWPNENPVGKRVKLSGLTAATSWTTVVGVIADARTESLEKPDVPQIYKCLFQITENELALFLRGRLDPARIPDETRVAVQSINSGLPVFGAMTLPGIVSGSLSQRRFSMEMVLIFALSALSLAALGIYGTISYLVNERTHEIGIRLALGATRGTILQMILRQGWELVITGTALGLVGALIVSHLMAGLLYGVRPTDPVTFVGVAILLIGTALLACYLPARRAMRVDPMVALRDE